MDCSYCLYERNSRRVLSFQGHSCQRFSRGEDIWNIPENGRFFSGERESWIQPYPSVSSPSCWMKIRCLPLGPDQEGRERILATLTDVTSFKETEEDMQEANRRLQRLSAHLQQVREEERLSVAREIHDELGQILTAAKMEAYLLRQESERSGATLNTAGLADLLDKAMASVHSISGRLRPSLLDKVSLEAAVKDETDSFSRRCSLPCTLRLEGPSPQDEDKLTLSPERLLSREEDSAVFRILQECLTNIARHAEARRVYITLKRKSLRASEADAPRLILSVEDDGVGIPPEKIASADSFGLMGMRERARTLKTTIDIRPRQPHGTRVLLEVP